MKNNLVRAILSLVVAFGLWLFVATVISPESVSEFDQVSVELVGISRLEKQNLMIVSDTSDLTVNLVLKGSRSDLNSLDKSDITVLLDLSDIDGAGVYELECTVSFKSGAAEVQSQDPKYITVEVKEQATVTVPIHAIDRGSVADGYAVDWDNMEMEYNMVTVTGPKDVVETIAYAGIDIELTNKNYDIYGDFDLTLYREDEKAVVDVQYLTMSVEKIRATVPIKSAKTVTVEIQPDWTGWVFDQSLATVTPSATQVTVMGNESILALLEDSYTVVLNMKDYLQSTTQTLELPLPEEIRDYVTCVDEIQVEIMITGLEQKSATLPESQFELVNGSPNISITLPKTVEVVIWGETDQIQKLQTEQLMIQVDCTNVTVESGLSAAVCTVVGHSDLKVIVLWEGQEVIAASAES